MRGDPLLGDERERREDARRARSGASCEAGATPESIPSSRRCETRTSTGRIAPTTRNVGSQPDQAQDAGRDERADRRRAHREAPRHAEHARQHVVGNGALEQREARDVDDAVGGADHREQDEHGHGVGERRHQHDRDAPADERPGERAARAARRAARPRRARRRGRRRRSRPPGSRPRSRPRAAPGRRSTTISTFRQPRTNVCEAIRPTRSRARGTSPIALKPSPDLDAATRSAARRRDPEPTRGRAGRPTPASAAGARREDHADVGERDEHAGAERAEQRAEALDRRGRAVRRDQLPRRPRERGQQRDERRPEERRADADDGRGGEDDDAVVQQRRPTAETTSAAAPSSTIAEQEPLAPEAIAERRGERRDRGRREQAHEAGDADGRGPAVAVGEHAERDEVRPLGRDRRAPGELGAADVRVLGP